MATDEEPLHVWTGLRWFLDVNVIDAAAAADLRRLHQLDWVWLSVTDTAHMEAMQNPETYARLLPQFVPYDIAHGVLTLDHSVLGMAVLGGEADDVHARAVYAAMWPASNYEADGQMVTRTGKNRFRDAMHVATAIRYRGTGFVTQDRGILRAADRIGEAFEGFAVLSISDAIERSIARAKHVRFAASVHGRPDPTTIPDWPTSAPRSDFGSHGAEGTNRFE
jgi:hypothetical protein